MIAAAMALAVSGVSVGIAVARSAHKSVPSRVFQLDVAGGTPLRLGAWPASADLSAAWASAGPVVAEQANTASGFGAGQILTFSGSGGGPVTRQSVATGVQAIVAPDGQSVAFLTEGSHPHVMVQGPAGVQTTFALPPNGPHDSDVGWLSLKGRWLAIEGGSFLRLRLLFFDTHTGMLRFSTPLSGELDALSFSSDETLAAWVPNPGGFTARRTMDEINLQTGRVKQILSLPGAQIPGPPMPLHAIDSPVFLPNSSTIAYVRDFNTVAFLPARAHTPFQPFDPSCNEIEAIAASPTGNEIALAYQPGDERLPIRLETVHFDGRRARVGPQLGSGIVDSLTYSPDGAHLLIAIGGLTNASGPIPRCS